MDLVPLSANESAFLLQDGDLLFARQSLVLSGAGQCSIFLGNTLPTVFESHIIRCRLNRSLANPAFYFYFFQSPTGRSAIRAIVEQGAGASGIRGSDLANVAVPRPPIHIQNEVAATLEAIDDRIDALQATNKTLEDIAQALFKSWFVAFDPVRAKAEGREPEGMDAATAALFPSEFEESELGLIPHGWRVGQLGELCKNLRDQAKPASIDVATPYIGLEHMPRGSIALTDVGTASGLASGKFWYFKDDVLFGKLRPYFHKVGVASHTGVCSTDILVIRAESRDWFGFTAMHLSSDAIISYATRLSNGAKMPRSSWSDLAKFRIAIPTDSVAAEFNVLVRSCVERIYLNVDAAKTLSSIRDTLLPRLISGKLRLPQGEVLAPDAA